jgi:hypothetical protein
MLEADLDLEDRGIQLTYDFQLPDQGLSPQFPRAFYDLHCGRAVLGVLTILLEKLKPEPGATVLSRLVEPSTCSRGAWCLRFEGVTADTSGDGSCVHDDPVVRRALVEFAELGYQVPFLAMDGECWTLEFAFKGMG